MKPLVSVIVPIYKVEDYLVRCLDSLCCQSLTNIEILLIDDASPDGCGRICNEYAEKDVRFRVLHNETNQGLSVARNIGIGYANSNYLMFVDGDDYVHKDFCKEAYESAMCFQADLVMFKFQYVKNDSHYSEQKVSCFVQSGYITREEATDFLILCGNFAWNKLYHKELFRHISYPPGYLYEDMGTTYKLVWKASRIYYLDKVLYNYCNRTVSITTQITEQALHDYFEMFMQQYRDLREWGYSPDKLNLFLQVHSLECCINYFKKKKPDAFTEHYVFCKNVLCNSKRTPIVMTWKQVVLFVLFKYCRSLFQVLCILHDKGIC